MRGCRDTAPAGLAALARMAAVRNAATAFSKRLGGFRYLALSRAIRWRFSDKARTLERATAHLGVTRTYWADPLESRHDYWGAIRLTERTSRRPTSRQRQPGKAWSPLRFALIGPRMRAPASHGLRIAATSSRQKRRHGRRMDRLTRRPARHISSIRQRLRDVHSYNPVLAIQVGERPG